MSFHRFDSSVATRENVSEHTFAPPNALRGISERLNAMFLLHSRFRRSRASAVQGGVESELRAECITVFKRYAYLFLDKLEVAKLSS